MAYYTITSPAGATCANFSGWSDITSLSDCSDAVATANAPYGSSAWSLAPISGYYPNLPKGCITTGYMNDTSYPIRGFVLPYFNMDTTGSGTGVSYDSGNFETCTTNLSAPSLILHLPALRATSTAIIATTAPSTVAAFTIATTVIPLSLQPPSPTSPLSEPPVVQQPPASPPLVHAPLFDNVEVVEQTTSCHCGCSRPSPVVGASVAAGVASAAAGAAGAAGAGGAAASAAGGAGRLVAVRQAPPPGTIAPLILDVQRFSLTSGLAVEQSGMCRGRRFIELGKWRRTLPFLATAPSSAAC